MWEWATGSPFLFTIIVIVLIEGLVNGVFHTISRVIRHLNIRKHGWPPPHVDADGDFRPASKSNGD